MKEVTMKRLPIMRWFTWVNQPTKPDAEYQVRSSSSALREIAGRSDA